MCSVTSNSPATCWPTSRRRWRASGSPSTMRWIRSWTTPRRRCGARRSWRATRRGRRRRCRRAVAEPAADPSNETGGAEGRRRHVRCGADVPAGDRPGRPAHDRRRAAARPADRGGQARRASHRRGGGRGSAVRGRREPHADAGRQRGRAGQERADAGQPAPGGQHRQAVFGPWDAAARSDPGGQPRADAGGRQVRLHEGLQVLDLCHVVDPAGDHPFDRRSGTHDPDSRCTWSST